MILICQVGPRRVLEGERDMILRDNNVSDERDMELEELQGHSHSPQTLC